MEGYAPIRTHKSSYTGFNVQTILLIATFLCLLYHIWLPDPLSPDERERVRHQWDAERRNKEAELGTLRKKIWEEQAVWEKQRAEAEEAWNVMRTNRDTERWKWEEERRERAKVRDEERRAEMEMEQERQRWEREDRQREERRRQEEEERERAGLYWQDLVRPDRCLRYGTREYTAKLANLPAGYNAMKGCLETEAEINGVKMAPHHCEKVVVSLLQATNSNCVSFRELWVECMADGSSISTSLPVRHGGKVWLTRQVINNRQSPCFSRVFTDLQGCTHPGSGTRVCIQNIRIPISQS